MVAKDKGLLADWPSKANVIEIDQSSALVDYIAPWTIDAQNTQEHSTTISLASSYTDCMCNVYGMYDPIAQST